MTVSCITFKGLRNIHNDKAANSDSEIQTRNILIHNSN